MFDQYLGDGVYISADQSGGVVLDLRGQDNTTRIVLEPEVLDSLDRYRVWLPKAIAAQKAAGVGQ